ncbi:MAG: hypothetical protein J6C46_06285 [Clostridia bacterium]|nr:hypothetical protein [Clostridia bacterium]
MKKKFTCKRIVSLMLLIVMLMTSSSVFAIWWGTPGYEWALTNKLTSVKSTSQLNKYVSLTDFYTTIIKYLQLKGIRPRNESIYHSDTMEGVDNVAKGIFNIINSYNSKESITIQQYYIVENYVEHAQDTLERYLDYSQYLTKDSLKNIDLYLNLSKYRAATLIGNRSDREYILSKLGYVKNSEIINYNMLPYAGNITRKEFLVVMYDLISSNEISEDAIIKAFYDSGVLIGFETGLELDKRITYSEMLTFLYRFEIFDFEPNAEKENAEEIEETEEEAEIR